MKEALANKAERDLREGQRGSCKRGKIAQVISPGDPTSKQQGDRTGDAEEGNQQWNSSKMS